MDEGTPWPPRWTKPEFVTMPVGVGATAAVGIDEPQTAAEVVAIEGAGVED